MHNREPLSAQEIHDLYNNAPCGYHSLDKDGVFVRINDTELSWLGYSRDEIIGKKKFSDLMTPESLRLFTDNFPSFKENGWIRDAEYELIRRDGTTMPVLLSASAIKDADGNYVMSRATLYDISERKKMEEKLREAELRYRTLFEESPDGILIIDTTGKFIQFNEKAYLQLGYSKEEFARLRVSDIAPYQSRKEMQATVREVLSGGHQEFEVKHRARNGEIRDVHVITQAIVLGGQPCFHSIWRDVTERRKAGEALRESEDKFRCLAEKSVVGVYLIQDGEFRYVNPKMTDIFGYSVEELTERMGPKDLVYHEDWRVVQDYLRRRISGEMTSIQYSFRGKTKDNRVIHVEVFGSGTLFQGKPAVIGSLLDITERKRMEEELRALSLRDQLTGLYNRRGFVTLTEHLLKKADRERKKLYTLYADLDNLKVINDTYGHQEGDRVLIGFAEILTVSCRNSDIIARIGGDEFAAIPVGLTDNDIDLVADRLLKGLELHNSTMNRGYDLSASIGIAYYDPERPCSVDELLAHGDKLMYEQKRLKRKA